MPTSLNTHRLFLGLFVCFFCLYFFCNAFLVPKFCHCKRTFHHAYYYIFRVSKSKSILSMFHVRPSKRSQFSLCIGCCLKMQDFYKKCLFFLYKNNKRFFVVLCIMVALPVDEICSRQPTESPQTLSPVGCEASNSAVLGDHFSHQSQAHLLSVRIVGPTAHTATRWWLKTWCSKYRRRSVFDFTE